jgi:hypothetical protein
MSRSHFYIPDVQIKPGVPLDHLDWIGDYVAGKKPDVIVCAGDWYDLPSLSFYDRGKLAFEGRRFKADVQAGHDALERFEYAMNIENDRLRRNKEKLYKPEKHVTWGNHEDRATRAAKNMPELDGWIGTNLFNDYWQPRGWTTHEYTEVVDIDGVWYSHLFLNEFTGQAMGAMASTLLKQIGHTFTQGHRQTYDLSTRFVGNKMHRALIAGACYLHDEDYKGPERSLSERSGNHHWRGCVMKHDVCDGGYSLMELPLDFFCRRYEQMSLKEFMWKKYRMAA